jgi:hypothetical protein
LLVGNTAPNQPERKQTSCEQVRLVDLAGTRSTDLQAMIDTGATHTTLDANIATEMRLLTSRQKMMTGASIGTRTAIALRPLLLLFLGGPVVRIQLDSALAFHDMERLAGTEMLLGRDLLRYATMIYDSASERVELRFV